MKETKEKFNLNHLGDAIYKGKLQQEGFVVCHSPPIIIGNKMVFSVEWIKCESKWENHGDFDIIHSEDLEKRFNLRIFYCVDTGNFYICYKDIVIGKKKHIPNYNDLQWIIMEYGNPIDKQFEILQKFLWYLNSFFDTLQEIKWRKCAKEEIEKLEGSCEIETKKITRSKERVKSVIKQIRNDYIRKAKISMSWAFDDFICDRCGKERKNDAVIVITDQFYQEFKYCSICGKKIKEQYLNLKFPQKRENNLFSS
ncbi:MAG: hypothetical protein ACFFDF_24240, partial [Candidatus Odinarchaeota archaeon]